MRAAQRPSTRSTLALSLVACAPLPEGATTAVGDAALPAARRYKIEKDLATEIKPIPATIDKSLYAFA